ncbi:TPA: hypothetical protein MC503_003337 [Citrobacter freundii]|nr:hypothetical protein [Citrobacter freundii]
MDKDNLPLLEDQNPVRRSEILAGTGSAKVALTEAIKSLSNVSGREADVNALNEYRSCSAQYQDVIKEPVSFWQPIWRMK